MSKAAMAESVSTTPPERCNIRIFCAVQDHSKATGTARTLLLVLARFANDDGECWPSIAVLAKLCNVSERGVQRAITTLVKDRELEVSRGSGITTSFYRICCLSGVTKVSPVTETSPVTEVTVTGDTFGERGDISGKRGVTKLSPKESIRKNQEKNQEKRETDRARRTRAPAELPVNDSMLRWAEDNGLSHVNLIQETEHMLDYFRAKGEARLDWVATWRTWMRNTRRFGGPHGGESEAEAKARRTREASERLRTRMDQQARSRVPG